MRALAPAPCSRGIQHKSQGESRKLVWNPSSLLKILCQFFCALHRLKAWIVSFLSVPRTNSVPQGEESDRGWVQVTGPFPSRNSVPAVLVTSEVFCYFLTAIFYTLLFFFLVSFVESTAPLLARWLHLKMQLQDLPGGPVVKNPYPNAGTWVRSWSRKIPQCRATQACVPSLLNLRSGAFEPQVLKPTRPRAGAPQWQ